MVSYVKPPEVCEPDTQRELDDALGIDARAFVDLQKAERVALEQAVLGGL